MMISEWDCICICNIKYSPHIEWRVHVNLALDLEVDTELHAV